MKEWIKKHAKQLGVTSLWLVGAAVVHFKPDYREHVFDMATVLLVAGFQLPPFTMKGASDVVKSLAAGTLGAICIGLVALGCSARVVVRDAYYIESEGCLNSYSTRAEQDKCLAALRQRWSEAGAPAALVMTPDASSSMVAAPPPVAVVAVPFDGGSGKDAVAE